MMRYLFLGLLVCVTATRPLVGAASKPDVVTLDEVHQGTPEIDLRLLNSYGNQPEPIQAFFATARRELATHPQAGFAGNPALLAAARAAGLTHLGGPLLGAGSPEGVRVWVRTLEPADVTVVVREAGTERRFGPVRSTIENELAAVVTIAGLKPGRHPYRVLVDGRPIAMPADAAISPYPVHGDNGEFRLAFGSCFHKRGLHNPRLLERIREAGSQALVLYGDLAVDDRDHHVGLHRSDYLLRDLSPAWRGVAASLPVYATWDDHDYFNNDRSGIPEGFSEADRRNVRRVWMQNWNNPAYGFGDEAAGGIFFRARVGPADLIMLDTRSLREGRRGERGSFLGGRQLAWLKEQLLACTGPFIVVTSGTMWSDDVSNGKDSWGIWQPEEREEILTFIETHRIPGVLLVSGDRHGARVFRMPRPSGHVFYEFEPASLGAVPGPPALAPDPSRQLFGVVERYAFGQFAFDTRPADPTVTFRLIAESGEILYALTLPRSHLTPPGS